ncbi:MAG: amidohydrolase family protein [Oscillospiraceae bacterium]|jgi:predicted TIM-barrel fold metal-dependent hydrolase
MNIDIFAHVLTPKYLKELDDRGIQHHPTPPASILWDPSERIEAMDKYSPGNTSVITMLGPDLESMVEPELAVKLARLGNDEMAELVCKHPEHFAAAVAMLPLSNIDAALKEGRRAIEELGMKGIQISSNIDGELLDSPRLFPIYEMMADYDLPIWIHPAFAKGPLPVPFDMAVMLHWPLDTSLAMIYLARSGVFEMYPNIKFITHHCGAFIPAFHPRIKAQYFDDPPYVTNPIGEKGKEYYKNLFKFYGDTAIYGNSTKTLELGYSFFGPDKLLYGTDFPAMTPEELVYAVRSVEAMDIPSEDKEKIFSGNAKRLLKL